MFSNNSYAKIKNVEDKENYAICKITISSKNRQTDQYETDFVGKVRFVGKAYRQNPQVDQRIKIVSCGVANCFIKDNVLEFPKSPNYTIFDYELQDGEVTPKQKLDLTEIEESELPF